MLSQQDLKQIAQKGITAEPPTSASSWRKYGTSTRLLATKS